LISASTLAAALLEAGAEGCAAGDEEGAPVGVTRWWLGRGVAVRCGDGDGRGVVAAGLAGTGLAGLADLAGPPAVLVLARLAPPVARRTATTAAIRIATVTARIR
jgi:hypothetical protein